MKKLLALVLTAGLLMPLLVGCGDDATKKPADKKATPTTPAADKGKTTPPASGATDKKEK